MLPTLFIAHGSPMLALEQNDYTEAIHQLMSDIPTPKAVVLFSAHYETPDLTVNRTQEFPMIYDFGGFPDDLYQIQYPARGSVAVADRVEMVLKAHHISYARESNRGLDHGAWVVLRILLPKADVPVLALSVSPNLSPEAQYAIGKVLSALREEQVLIVGSGGTVHNLRAVMWDSDKVAEWAIQFDDWLDRVISAWDLASLFRYREIAPGASMAVPDRGREHFSPLLYAMGAADNTRQPCLKHCSYRYGTLSHTIWQFN